MSLCAVIAAVVLSAASYQIELLSLCAHHTRASNRDGVVVNWMRYFAAELSQRGVVRLGLRVQQSAGSETSANAHSTISTGADNDSATASDGELAASSHSNSSSNVNSSGNSLSSSSSSSSQQQQGAKQMRYNKQQEQKRSTPRTPGQLLELETQHKILVSTNSTSYVSDRTHTACSSSAMLHLAVARLL
jgi:hypothetical protein